MMASEPAPLRDTTPWTDRKVVTFAGQLDTRIRTGEDYATLSLSDIFAMEPASKPKGASPSFIPSVYRDYDAREHAKQRERGKFVALCGDVDHGDHPLLTIERLVRTFAGDAAWLIYSSAHAQPGDMRWRIIIPLDQPQSFADWHDAQHAFFAHMECGGVAMDRALDRAAQPVYLPNVPATHAKTGTALRDFADEPLHYSKASTGADKQGLRLDAGPIATGIATIRTKRAEDDSERDRIRREAEQRRANMPQGDGGNIIADFNARNSLATMLELCGYEQSPRSAEDWRSPNQTGETYATRIIADKWVSLSASDTAARVGETCKSGCFGDAYDLYVHYKHGGDHKGAFRALHAERKAAQPNVIYGAFAPAGEVGDPGWEDIPDWATPDDEPEEADLEAGPSLDVFDPADWQGTPPPVRQWRWDGFIPIYQATLLTGAGAAGKSLAMQQMSTCVAMGLPFLGVETVQCPSLYITCEDDMEELHRRQEAICNGLGIYLEQTRGRLFLLSLQGAIGNELATFTPDGKMAVAERYNEIEQTCLALGVRHVTIDNTAHTFSGNENDRHQVAAFVNLNNRLAQAIGGSVVMVGHPNKAGDSYSGSTAWENQVRSRLYLEIPKNGDEGVPIDPDMRVLRNEKANYSQRGAEVRFWWIKGAFVTEDQIQRNNDGERPDSSLARYENQLFLDLLARLTEQRRHVTHAANLSNYAPKVMAAMPEAHGIQRGAFSRAMERLFAAEEIEASRPLWNGSNRHPVLGLARKM